MARSNGLNFAKRHKRVSSDVWKEVINYVAGITVAVVLAFFLVFNFGIRTNVIGISMANTLYNGQTILINKLSYLIMKPKVGDIIVFKPNGNQNSHYYIKRVVAVPGDTVQIIGGELVVNGKTQNEEEFDKIADPGIAENPITLGVDEYFVLGDNRNNSEDSRFGNIGPVEKSLIEGRAWFKLGYNDSYTGIIKRGL